MRRMPLGLGVALWLVFAPQLGATIFGNLRGIVHDPEHRPVEGARVTIHSRTSDWSRATQSNADGEFEFNTVPVGEYSIEVAGPDFATSVLQLTINSGSAPVLHFPLDLARLGHFSVENQGSWMISQRSLIHGRLQSTGRKSAFK